MEKKIIEELSNQFRIISTQAVIRSQLIANKLKINSTDLETIEVLFRYGRITAGNLANELRLTTGAITGIVDRLEKKGFAQRELDTKDRRKVFIAINMENVTKKVVPLYTSLSIKSEELMMQYPEKDIKLIIDFLSKMVQLSNEDLKSLS